MAPAYPHASTAWYFIAVLVVASIVSYLDRQVLNLLVDPVRRALLVSDTQISLLQGIAFTLFYSVAGIWIGGVIDRRNRRNIVVMAVVMWSGMTMYCGLASSYTELLIGRIGVAVGEACLVPASYSLLSDLFPPNTRGRAAGVLTTGMALGNGLSMLVGGVLLALLSPAVIAAMPDFFPREEWNLVFLLVGVIGLPVALLVLTVREPRRIGVSQHAAPPTIQAALQFLKANAAALGTLFGASAIAMSVSNALIAWGATILIRDLGQNAAQAGISMGLSVTIGGAIGPLIIGYLSDRNVAAGKPAPRMRLFLTVCPIMSVGVVLIAFVGQLGFVLVGMFIVMMCGHSFATIMYASIQDICPNQLRARIVAVGTLGFSIGGALLGPTLVAVVKEAAWFEGQSMAMAYGIAELPLILVGGVIAALGITPFARAQARIEYHRLRTL